MWAIEVTLKFTNPRMSSVGVASAVGWRLAPPHRTQFFCTLHFSAFSFSSVKIVLPFLRLGIWTVDWREVWDAAPPGGRTSQAVSLGNASCAAAGAHGTRLRL